MAGGKSLNVEIPSIRKISEGGTTSMLFKPKKNKSNQKQRQRSGYDHDSQSNRYGWCGFEPQWLQRFHKSHWLVFVIFVQMSAIYMQNGIFFAVASTLERQFHMSNTQLGIIFAAGDVSAVFLPIVVAYFAQNGHKGRWITAGFLVYAIANALLTLAQWTSKVGVANTWSNRSSSEVQYCTNTAKDVPCSNEVTSAAANWGNKVVYMFLVLRLIQSFSTGTSPLAVTYIDETVAQKDVALFITMITGAPQTFLVVGIMLGAAILNIHADFYRLDVRHLEKDDPQWYGAWWIAYLIVSCQLLLAAIPMLGFAKELPEKQRNRLKDVDQSHATGVEDLLIKRETGGVPKSSNRNSEKDFFKVSMTLIRNPVFVLLVFRNSVQFSIVTGITMFMSIYLQHAFSMSQRVAPMITAACWIFPFIIGGFIGSFVVKWKQFHVKHILVMALLTNLIAYSFFMVYLNHCSQGPVAGLPSNQRNDPSSLESYTQTCNLGCNCNFREPSPMCWNKTTYFSPCHAGCHEIPGIQALYDRKKHFNISAKQCVCLRVGADSDSSLLKETAKKTSLNVTRGICPRGSDCRYRRILFCVLCAIGSLIGGLGGTPTFQAFLHSVPLKNRTIAMGFHSCILKAFHMCGPIVVGTLFDRSCLLWTQSCGKKGACFQYDVSHLSIMIAVMFIVGGILSTLALFLAILLYRPANRLDIDQKQEG